MDLYPAIDLRDGGAVRLTQGDFDREAALRGPAGAGGAVHRGRRAVDPRRRPQRGPHRRAARAAPCWPRSSALVTPAGVPRCRPAGASAREDDVAAVLDLGVARVVLGTAALEDPALATRCARRWPGQVAVGLDYVAATGRRGRGTGAATGWQGPGLGPHRPSPSRAARALGGRADRGGGGHGHRPRRHARGSRPRRPRAPAGWPLTRAAGHRLRRGGVARRSAGPGCAADGRRPGVIVGKALVEGRFRVEEAVAACAASV